MNIGHYDWFDKEADFQIAEQNKVRHESQTRRMMGESVESGIAMCHVNKKYGLT